jgi:hypothetical protein
MRNRMHSARVKAADLRPRLQNFAIPLPVPIPIPTFGPSRHDHDKAIARQVVADLEGRRVLYSPWQLEIEQQCVDSVLDMRTFLSAQIGELDKDSPLSPSLRQMRAACLRFLDESNGPPWHGFHGYGPMGGGGFWYALGELRAVVGICLATIAERYGLDVEAELAVILPPEPSDLD